MSRLIDADRLLAYIEESRAPSFFCNEVCDLFTKWVNKQPTAFDKDKVLEELELGKYSDEQMEKYHSQLKARTKSFNDGMATAIKIVKKGGVE